MKVDVAFGDTPKGGPPGPEDGPLGLSRVAMHAILDIAFAVLDHTVIIHLS
jgi:hypothetical protein